MSPLTVSEIAIFAQRHSVPANQAYTLPTIFDKIAQTTGKPVRTIISQATYSNIELANYIKELVAQVA